MAQMIPAYGPAETGSKGEIQVYHLLKAGLSDEFTVVHSLPWLCAAVREIDAQYAPTGEIDFLVIHRRLGVLVLEVKGGIHKVHGSVFVHATSGKKTYVAAQTRRNVHGLARWLGSDPALRVRIGYGFVFPHSVFGEAEIGVALRDVSVPSPQAIFVDRSGLIDLAQRVQAIMEHWWNALGKRQLTEAVHQRLLQTLCPEFDGTPNWAARVDYDNKHWLRLTQEQAAVVEAAERQHRIVVTGWPGTGKTVIAVELARRAIASGRRVLFLTFNKLLGEYLHSEIGSGQGDVGSWHAWCSKWAWQTGGRSTGPDWLDRGCLEAAKEAEASPGFRPFDVLILDEAQAFRKEWCEWLSTYFMAGRVIAFCDETQVFSFEKNPLSVGELCTIFGTKAPFSLTIALRSPKAVLNHLQRVRLPAFQLHSPREHDEQGLKELVVPDVEAAVLDLLNRFESEGINPSDVAVLTKYTPMELVGRTATFETVSRYRGMEAPIVIVAGAESMDDVELFSAYSRATTTCIALYDAETLGFLKEKGRFHELLLENAQHRQVVDDAVEQARTITILKDEGDLSAVELQSVRIWWSSRYRGWCVDGDNRSEAAAYWIDYLASYFPWPVYYWYSSSCRELLFTASVNGGELDGVAGYRMSLGWCVACNAVCPQHRPKTLLPLVCFICSGAEVRPKPEPEVFAALRDFDAIVSSDAPKELSADRRNSLPLVLAALAARRFAGRNALNWNVQLNSIAIGGVLNRAALGFIYSRIAVKRPGTRLIRDDLAKDLSSRFVLPPGTTPETWRQVVARALGWASVRGLLRKRGTGVYEVVDVGALVDS
jgi:hypothetical protein